jgi:hypothetical protein
VLVNNAAILYDTWQRVIDADLTQVREAFETNTCGRSGRGERRLGGDAA